jgi:Tetratricopeptide repeat
MQRQLSHNLSREGGDEALAPTPRSSLNRLGETFAGAHGSVRIFNPFDHKFGQVIDTGIETCKYARDSCEILGTAGPTSREFGKKSGVKREKGREIKMPSIRFRLLASLAFVALCWGLGQARAGDLEECLGPAVEGIEVACTAILNDAQRPTEDRVKAYGARSRLFNARGKFDAGLADAEAALQLNPLSVGALLSRAYARQRTGNFDAALADYNHALELEPKNPSVLTSRAGLRIDRKAWSEALADLNQAIALRQDYAQAYVARARVHVETAQLDQALSDLNGAVDECDRAEWLLLAWPGLPSQG